MKGGQVTVEVQRTDTEVRLIIGAGEHKTIYKLGAKLAREVGEELYREGCNLQPGV